MTLAYFDCFSGISGDMTLGALVDAGVSIDLLRSELSKLNLPGYTLSAEKVKRSGIAATKVHVTIDKKDRESRHLSDIVAIINGSSLSDSIKDKSINIRISSRDLEALQRRAIEEGLPYQSLVSSVLHKYVSGGFKDISAIKALQRTCR